MGSDKTASIAGQLSSEVPEATSAEKPRLRNYGNRKKISETVEHLFWKTRLPVHFARLILPKKVRLSEHAVAHETANHPPLRIAFASDFHSGPTTHPKAIHHACETLHATQADILLLGGDFVSYSAEYIDHIIDKLASIHAPLGRYAVLGNHDLYGGYEYIEKRLRQSGIHVISNANVRLPAPWDNIWLCGLDDPHYGFNDVEAAFRNANGTRIVLMHSPSSIVEIGEHRFELALCGHTHGGQIALPSGKAILTSTGKMVREYNRGRFDVGNGRTMIVSLGIGCSGPPIRVNAPPEVHVCTLEGKKISNY